MAKRDIEKEIFDFKTKVLLPGINEKKGRICAKETYNDIKQLAKTYGMTIEAAWDDYHEHILEALRNER